jgi:flavin-dependent thymidylate synthase
LEKIINQNLQNMQVKLINYTQNALETLLYTKNTRLQAEASIEDVVAWDEEKKLKELDYMLKTIQSSWEFVDYTFEITGASRAFTHQLVRTRDGSYAQQSQRTVDMSDSFDFVMPDNMDNYNIEMQGSFLDRGEEFLQNVVDGIKSNYRMMVDSGVPPQDARSILPTNTATNIIAKFDLRTLSHMAKTRLCTRTQGEYQKIFKAMKAEVVKVHPWAEKFIRVYCSAVGVCQFPNYKECPIKPDIFNPESGKTWRETEGYEAPKNAIDLIQEETKKYTKPRTDEVVFEVSFLPKRPATKDEIEAGFLKMNFEAVPLWKAIVNNNFNINLNF